MLLILSTVLVLATVLILARQTLLLSKQIGQQEIHSRFDYWNKITDFETKYPQFHRMLISEKNAQLRESLSDTDLGLRAMAWLLFDKLSYLYHETRPTWSDNLFGGIMRAAQIPPVSKEFHLVVRQIERTLSNEVMRSAWREWALRDEWEGDDFQTLVDLKLSSFETLADTGGARGGYVHQP